MNLKEDGVAAVATPSLTTGVEGPVLPIKPKNTFRRVSELKKKRDAQLKQTLNK